MANTCTPYNAAAFNRKLEEQRKKAEEAFKKACEKSARETADLMRRNAPVGPTAPHIRDTIDVVPYEDGMGVRVGSPDSPAVPIEQGHRAKDGTHVPGARFIYPARKVVGKRHRGRVRRAARSAAKDVFK